MDKWPRDNQADLINFYGDPGSGSMALNLVKVTPPFKMTYDGNPVASLTFHKLAAPALQRALNRVWDYYGRDQKKIDALGISKTAGTYNPRMIRGSATKWSNHAYGAAIDINAEQNGFNVEGNIPIPMIAAFKAEGARWGGDYRSRPDPMHFEFCESGEPARTFEQWLAFYGAKGGQPAPVTPKGITADMRWRMAKKIVDFEARRDSKGRLAVYHLPANDGGGTYEVAGINDRYHPEQAAKLKALIEAGKYSEAEASIIEYLLNYTKSAEGMSDYAGPQFYLRDSVFNRGPTGAVEILQHGLGVSVDGNLGRETRDAGAKLSADELLVCLRRGREKWEDERDRKKGPRPNLRPGLVNRWDKALVAARAFQKEQGALPAVVKRTIGIGLGGGVIYAAWDWIIANPVPLALIVFIAVGAFVIIRKIRGQ